MAVADDLIALVDAVGPRSLPVARALVVPPAKTPGQVAGEFCAVVLDDQSVGLAYLLLDDTFERLAARPGLHGTFPADARILAGWLLDRDPVHRAIGMAAINAISQHLFRRGGFVPGADDALGGLVPTTGERFGMVGLFPPLVRRIVGAGAALVVVERRRELVGRYDGYEVSADPRMLEGCDKVVVTSTTIMNGTLDTVLGHCGRAREIVVLGPGGGCLPDPLFARGVTAVAATGIVDTQAFVTAVQAGAAWSGSARKYLIRRESYPGARALAAARHPVGVDPVSREPPRAPGTP